jgi:hypothetical protein
VPRRHQPRVEAIKIAEFLIAYKPDSKNGGPDVGRSIGQIVIKSLQRRIE